MRTLALTRKLTLLLVVGALATATVAQRGGGRYAMPAAKGNHVVVQVENKLSIVRKSQVAWYKQQLGTLNMQAMKQWKDARKEAKKNKVKFATKKPTKKKLKVVNANSKTEEAARKILEALIAKSEKSKKSKVKLEEANVLGEARGRGGRDRGGRDRGGAGGRRRGGDDGKGGDDADKGKDRRRGGDRGGDDKKGGK